MRAGELRAKHLARDGALDQQYRQMQELSKQFAFQPAASDTHLSRVAELVPRPAAVGVRRQADSLGARDPGQDE